MRASLILRKQTVELLLTVVEVVAPVFLLAGIGFAWVRMGFSYDIQFVTRMAMTLAVPALMFTSLVKTSISPQALSKVLLAAVVAYAVVTLAALVITKVARLEIRTYFAPLIFGNTGNLGLPLAYFAYGDEGLGYAVVIFAFMAIYAFTFGVWVVSGGGSPIKALREPMVGATLLGAVFLWQDWQTPVFLTNTLELLGQMAIPLMLITLGVAVARLKPGRMGKVFALSLVRAVLFVGLTWTVGLWFGLGPVPLGVLVLQVSTPVAVTSYLLAEKYGVDSGADAGAVAGLVVASTLLSIATIPLTLAFFL